MQEYQNQCGIIQASKPRRKKELLEKFVYKVGVRLVNNPAPLVEPAPVLIVAGAACAVADLVDKAKQEKN